MAIVAGVDASTQSSTVELRDADSGVLLGGGRALHPLTYPPVSEQRPEAWWEAFTSALGAAATDAGVAISDIDAISVAGQCHGLVMLDADGRPLRAAKLWNDTTSAPQSERMVAELGGDAWAEAVGSVPIAAFTISKLAWMAEHEPEVLARTARIMQPHDYLTFRLTGRAVTDRSEASGTGYYAAHEGRWRLDLLDRFVAPRDWAPMLSTVLGPDEPAGTVCAAAADELGLRRDAIVGAGGGDQHLGAVGLGLRDGDVAYSIGTSGVVMTMNEQPVFDGSGIVTGVANAVGGYLPLACTLNSTKVTDWAARTLGVGIEELGAMALSVDAEGAPPAGRPVFAAYLDGERTPNRPLATGTIAGLTTATSREEIARAAFEGVLFGMLNAHEHLQTVGADADGEVMVMGGGARGIAYRQILADLLGRPVVVRDVEESTARGAAIQAAAVLRGRPVAELAEELRPAALVATEPRDSDYTAVRERYRTLAEWTGTDRAGDDAIGGVR
ncbi:xylulokinase [Leucobacter tenebrionis]|uniref:xylulokinase n=1 Tax=Leucobacter tenebrionis TaxID=2873270 RepID=UPI001CA665FF|nr:xylulokinase [Leucobacter tenebrionis]QZY52952.1 xylulokinase [Leucobacter tenebrionis]